MASMASMMHGRTPNRETLLPTRYSLLSRLQNWDDQDSWRDFFDTYWRLIYAVAIKAGLSDAEAQDVVQETVITVAKEIHTFKRDRDRGSFKGWLRNITRWRIADHLRKRERDRAADSLCVGEGVAEADLKDVPDPAGGALEAVWENEWQENLFAAALERVKGRVKEEHFQMFDLYAVKQWPVAKVARMVGVSTAQVYLAKHRITALIKKEIRALEKQLI
jgi:RNA polymerase sigma-70 factor (ECF subfamily)